MNDSENPFLDSSSSEPSSEDTAIDEVSFISDSDLDTLLSGDKRTEEENPFIPQKPEPISPDEIRERNEEEPRDSLMREIASSEADLPKKERRDDPDDTTDTDISKEGEVSYADVIPQEVASSIKKKRIMSKVWLVLGIIAVVGSLVGITIVLWLSNPAPGAYNIIDSMTTFLSSFFH